MGRPFYVTTAIDYPNGAPHLGHLYEKLVADTYARWYRQAGREVYFLTGTDENGQKLMKSAEAAGLPTQTYVDQNAELFRKMCADLHLTNNDFIRTTESRHIAATQQLWQKLESKGDVYFGRYSGNYCISCESFYPDNQVVENRCPEHGIKLEYMEADGYFFRMSKYQNWITQLIRDNAKFLFPSSARKEILSRLEGEELRDLSISRPNQGWGIAVPGNDKHVIYTWFDALINYYAGVIERPELHKFWPASMHVIGKDITWFHSVIWPVMLHAADIAIPEQVYVHGMLLAADGKKMSKSLGNVVSPYELIGNVSNDLIRYFMVRAVASGQDGAFSIQDLISRHNNELANDLGNLIMRVVKLTLKRVGSDIGPAESQQELRFESMRDRMCEAMDAREHHRAVDILWEGVNQINGYLNQYEPWRIKDNPTRFHECMYNALHGLGCIAVMAQSFIPDTSQKLAEVIGIKFEQMQMPAWGSSFKLTEPQSLFPKIELNAEGKITVQAAKGQ
jgi:methionyl-tRNA synthetase